ncbi:hypothetical protein EDD15DRAFT_1813187 [Pisolithus albus]|nr:hypothetical protein EDD15DRAFT_1813187 [Pisolithus albus]
MCRTFYQSSLVRVMITLFSFRLLSAEALVESCDLSATCECMHGLPIVIPISHIRDMDPKFSTFQWLEMGCMDNLLTITNRQRALCLAMGDPQYSNVTFTFVFPGYLRQPRSRRRTLLQHSFRNSMTALIPFSVSRRSGMTRPSDSRGSAKHVTVVLECWTRCDDVFTCLNGFTTWT